MRKKFTLHQSNRLSSIILRSATIIFALALATNFATTLAPTLKANAETSSIAAQVLNSVQKVESYNSELGEKTNDEILSTDETKLKLLQREFVNRVGYDKLTEFIKKSEDNAEVLNWLFMNKENLEEYLLGGNPEGTQKDRNALYSKSLQILSDVYKEHKADLQDPTNGNVYKRMMMAISLAYAVDVNHWQTVEVNLMPDKEHTAQRTPSDPNERYSLLKKLFTDGYSSEGIQTHFENEVFKDLEVEEMRWVVNNRTGDKDIPWLNWYTQKVKTGATGYGKEGYMNPYNYINYSGGIRWDYENHKYYEKDSTYCALSSVGNLNPHYGLEQGYQRGESCNTKYGLEAFGIQTGADPYLHQWIIWEEDGVCGSIAGVGTNIQMAYGIPSSLVSQPGHAAYFQSNQELKDWKNGPSLRFWNINNSVASWGNSYKGERMPLDWGTKYQDYWTDGNNASYLLLGQRAIDNMDKFRDSFYYNLLAKLHEGNQEKQLEDYKSAIGKMDYNFDSWVGIVNIANEMTLSDEDYFNLAKAIMQHLKEFPLPMHDLLKRFSDRMEAHQIAYNNTLNSLLTELANIKVDGNTDYFQAQAVKDIANYLLGKQENTDIASFSFDGENAMQLRLEGTFREHKTPFEYTIDGSSDDPTSGDWKTATNGELEIDLTDVASQLSYEKDIRVHALATARTAENIFTIDLLKPDSQDIKENNLERRVVGIDENNAEWVQIEAPSEEYNEEDDYYQLLLCSTFGLPDACANVEKLNWTKFSDKKPEISDEGNQLSEDFSGVGDLYVRKTASGLYTKSDPTNVIFKPVSNTPQRTYIPNSQVLSVTSSIGPEKDLGLSKLLDGDTQSYWISDPEDDYKYLIYSLDNPVLLSDLEYIAPTDFSSGRGNIESAKLEVSLTGEEDDYRTIEEEIKWPFREGNPTYAFHLSSPAYAKYIKITPLQTHVAVNQNGQPVYYDRTHVSMYNFYQDTTAKIDISLLDKLIKVDDSPLYYNKEEQKPTVTISDYDNTTLTPEKDYQITYENNRNAGTATMKIKGTGERYTGEVTKEFTINKAPNPPDTPEDSYDKSSDTEQKLSSFQLPNDWYWENGDQTIKPGESLLATALYNDQDNYENARKDVKISVTKPTTPPTIDPDPSGPTNPDPSKPTDPDPSTPTDPTNPANPDTPTNPVDPSIPAGPNDQPGANSPPQSGSTTAPSTSSSSSDANLFANPSSGTQIADNYSAGSHARSNPVNPATGNSTNDNLDNKSADSTSKNTETSESQVADNAISDDSSTSGQQSSGNRNILPYIIAGIFAASILAIFYFLFRRRNKE